MAGVFPGKQAVFDAVDVSQGVEAALRSARHVLETARLQPSVFDGVIGRLAAQEPVNIGQGDYAGIGEEFGHEVCVEFGVSNALWLADSEMVLNRTSDDKADRAFLFGADIAEGLYQMGFEANG